MAHAKRHARTPVNGKRGRPSKAMKTYTYTILIHRADPDETGYWVEVPALPGCFTQGETVDECIERAHEAIAGHVAALVKEGEPVPEEPQREGAVVGQVKVDLPVPA